MQFLTAVLVQSYNPLRGGRCETMSSDHYKLVDTVGLKRFMEEAVPRDSFGNTGLTRAAANEVFNAIGAYCDIGNPGIPMFTFPRLTTLSQQQHHLSRSQLPPTPAPMVRLRLSQRA